MKKSLEISNMDANLMFFGYYKYYCFAMIEKVLTFANTYISAVCNERWLCLSA